jgi:hypothetical protein
MVGHGDRSRTLIEDDLGPYLQPPPRRRRVGRWLVVSAVAAGGLAYWATRPGTREAERLLVTLFRHHM